MLTVVPRAVPLLSPAAFKGYESFLTRVFSGRVPECRVRAAAGLPRDARIPPDAYARVYPALARVL